MGCVVFLIVDALVPSMEEGSLKKTTAETMGGEFGRGRVIHWLT